jgi:hypothetical protein
MTNMMYFASLVLSLAITGCTLPAQPGDPSGAEPDARPVPELCQEIFKPVCGVDGVTYSNECYAHQAGVDVLHEEDCEKPLLFELKATDTCPRGQQSCPGCPGHPDICVRKGTSCPIIRCLPPPEATCNSGDECKDSEFCNFSDDTCGDTGSQPGVCSPSPAFCTKIYAPVCGCDGRTYGNECGAQQSGVDVVHEGECGKPDVSNDCHVGGCSGELCVGPGEPDVSTCVFRPEAACYETAACERQAGGSCGWTPTPKLDECLAQFE